MSDIKLYQGDCLEVMKAIPDNSIDLVLTDPPYGTTACAWDSVIPFDLLWDQYRRICKPNSTVVLFGSEPFSTELRHSNLKQYRYDLIWIKEQASSGLFANSAPLKIHENISVFYSSDKKNGTTYNPQMTFGKEYSGHYAPNASVHGDGTHYVKGSSERYPTSILRFNREVGYHPTQKPVDLLEWLISTYSNAGDTVLDSCMGSGSTGVAAKILNRNFIGIELDENYFNIAEGRINAAVVGEAETARRKPIPDHKVHKFF